MTLAIVIVILIGYVFIASEHLTHVNKALVAVFCASVGWVLFMCSGTSMIDVLHAQEFRDFLAGEPYSLYKSKVFISDRIFLRYVGEVGALVLYLLATMNIVQVLLNNECFWFIEKWLRSRNTNVVVWVAVLVTFVMSTCIDTLTLTVMMLMVLRRLLRNGRQRMYVGAAVVIAANAGGCWTVIGDVTGLMVWTSKAVAATNFSLMLLLPAVVATIVPVSLICRKLPEHLDLERPAFVFRGDDSVLKVWQRLLLLVFGIGGLWFIPSFHRITLLPPFLGALCCLGVVWVLNEIINKRRIGTEQPLNITSGRTLQYECIQAVMYCVGVCLCVDVLIECGALHYASALCDRYLHNIYLISLLLGFISSIMDNIALVLTSMNMYSVLEPEMVKADYMSAFLVNGEYWHLIMLSVSVGGCLLPIGSVAGLALMKSEGVTVWWYLRRISLYVLLGWICSLGTYFMVDAFLRTWFPNF